MYNLPKFPETPESFAKKVQQTVRENMEGNVGIAERSKAMKNNWKKKAVAAAVALALVSAGGITVYAVADSVVKARMENMAQEEKTELLDELYSADGVAEASFFSRELSSEEKMRFYELRVAYQTEGRFPEGEFKRIEKEEDVEEDVLCYLPETRCFYLPERELTDEEFLQMIDWTAKTNYALHEQYEQNYPEEIKAREEEQASLSKKVQESGGIDEAGAREKAAGWLQTLYGKTEEKMEVSVSLDDSEESLIYCVSFSIGDAQQYSFGLDAADGKLCNVNYYGKEMQMEEMTVSDVEDKAASLGQQAESYLRDDFGISGDCREVYYAYNIDENTNNNIAMNILTFHFIMEDDTVYVVTLDSNSGVLELFYIRSYEEYQQSLETHQELREKGVVTYETVLKKLR